MLLSLLECFFCQFHKITGAKSLLFQRYKVLNLIQNLYYVYCIKVLVARLLVSNGQKFPGSYWGDEGYIKMASNVNICGIASKPLVPLV